jgi:putative FmdB family regulatory protein
MPTYEYRCERCGHNVEVVQSFTDAPLTTCEACAGPLRKVYAPVGIVFKGSGFYKTDSRSSKTSKTPAASSSDGTSGAEKTKKRDGDKRDGDKKDGDKLDAKKDGAVASASPKAEGGSGPSSTPAATGASANKE